MSFQLVDERTEQVITKFFTRSPTITFVSEISGKQYITVTLSEVKEVNSVVSGETALNTITIEPEELFGIPLIHPQTGQEIVVDGNPMTALWLNPIIHDISKIYVTALQAAVKAAGGQ